MHASYSTPGAALFVSAPGGDHESITNHVTANVDGGCRGAGAGTAFASPVVSGVIALMLEANPDLTWRDVQGVLASTSRMVFDDLDDTSRVRNVAGLYHSNLYGFGIIDAESAVAASKSWDSYGPERMLTGNSGNVNLTIADNATTSVRNSVISITNNGEDFITESVVVLLDLEHFSRGNLEVVLASPQGTISILHPGQRLENTQLDAEERWKLMTVRAWGENAVGSWSLSIRDLRSGDATECVDLPFLTVYNEQQWTCISMTENGLCVDGSPSDVATNGTFDDLLTAKYKELTVEEACCECGGGISTTDFVDSLKRWTLVVYGREGIATRAPTDFPSDNPSISPSSLPSGIPSTTPSAIDSIAPSDVPTELPLPFPESTSDIPLSRRPPSTTAESGAYAYAYAKFGTFYFLSFGLLFFTVL
jgi:hypothetical protein